MPEAVIRWFASGGRFEGNVDSTGLVSAGSTGTLNVAAVAGLAGQAVRSTVAFAHITVLPQPATTIVVTPRPERLLAGTALVLAAAPYAPNGDRRYDQVTWKSSRAAVDGAGVFVADQPGTYRVIATLGARTAEGFVQVAPRNITRQVTIVGRLPLKGLPGAELWLHPDGKHAYISTIGDRIYAIDVSDPAKPVFTDSVVVD